MLSWLRAFLSLSRRALSQDIAFPSQGSVGSWAAQGKENKEIKGAQDPRMKGYFLSSSPPLVPFDSYNWFTLGGQNQLMESMETKVDKRPRLYNLGIRMACRVHMALPD